MWSHSASLLTFWQAGSLLPSLPPYQCPVRGHTFVAWLPPHNRIFFWTHKLAFRFVFKCHISFSSSLRWDLQISVLKRGDTIESGGRGERGWSWCTGTCPYFIRVPRWSHHHLKEWMLFCLWDHFAWATLAHQHHVHMTHWLIPAESRPRRRPPSAALCLTTPRASYYIQDALVDFSAWPLMSSSPTADVSFACLLHYSGQMI